MFRTNVMFAVLEKKNKNNKEISKGDTNGQFIQ